MVNYFMLKTFDTVRLFFAVGQLDYYEESTVRACNSLTLVDPLLPFFLSFFPGVAKQNCSHQSCSYEEEEEEEFTHVKVSCSSLEGEQLVFHDGGLSKKGGGRVEGGLVKRVGGCTISGNADFFSFSGKWGLFSRDEYWGRIGRGREGCSLTQIREQTNLPSISSSSSSGTPLFVRAMSFSQITRALLLL